MEMITSSQEKQIVRLTESAVSKAATETAEEVLAGLSEALDKEAVQQEVIERGNNLKEAMQTVVTPVIRQMLTEFLVSCMSLHEGAKTMILIKAGGSNPYCEETLECWFDFWFKEVGLKNSKFIGITPFVEHAGYRPLVLPKHELITPQFLYDCCKERFNGKCCKWCDYSLDKVVTKNDRDPRAGAYVVWFKDVVEADENLKNLSANTLVQMGIPGITLLEREVMEYDHFNRTNGHLDINNVTLCGGSRYGDGDVPSVGWSDGKMCVVRYRPNRIIGSLRSRQQFSL
ncbi:MAG: hypothetical protein WCK11_00625 [Candidatus Falkowbacteria bacterium]